MPAAPFLSTTIERLVVKKKYLRKYWVVYLLMLPALVGFLIFSYVPMAGIAMAFTKYRIGKGFAAIFSSPWVGLEQFWRMSKDFYFLKVLKNTLLISFYKILFAFPAPVLFALLINELNSRKFKRLIQTVSYLPSFLSAVVIYGLVLGLLSPSYGLINGLIEKFGGVPIHFLANQKYFRGIIVGLDIWRYTGWDAIIYLAGITSINPEIYEAAIVDGAGKFRRMRHITLPGISDLVFLMFIFRIGAILDAGFESVFLLYSPAVYSVGDIIDTYVYRIGLTGTDPSFSYATAVGLFKSVIGFFLVMSVNIVAKRYDKVGIW